MPQITFYIPDDEIEKIMWWNKHIANPREGNVHVTLNVVENKDWDNGTLATFKCDDIEIH